MSAEGLEDPYRWTLSEYLLRAELTAGREVLVEGLNDLVFIRRLLRASELDDVTVLDAGCVVFTDQDRKAYGPAGSVRSDLLVIAECLARRKAEESLEATVLVVVDRDYEDALPAVVDGIALTTDVHSVETYALTASALVELDERYLARKPTPGSNADADPRVGQEWLARVVDAGVAIASVRVALRQLAPGCGVKGIEKSTVVDADNGRVTVDAPAILKKSLQAGGVPDQPDLERSREDLESKLSASPETAIRGRDLVALLVKVLRSGWGKATFGLKPAGVTDELLGRWLVLSVPDQAIANSGLAQAVRAGFA